MNVLTDNKILDATITSINGSENFPATNLQNVFLHQRYQSTTVDDTVTIVFDTSIDIDVFFFGYTNMSTMTVDFYDASNVKIESYQILADGSVIHYYGYGLAESYGYDDQFYGYYIRNGNQVYDPVAWYLSQTLSVKKIVITLETESTNVFMGGIACGVIENFSLPLSTWIDDFDDKSLVSESEAGQVLQQYLPPFRKYKFNFPVNSRADVIEVMNKYRAIGVGYHLWVDPFEDNHDFMVPIYCTLTAPIKSKKDGTNYSYDLNIREAR